MLNNITIRFGEQIAYFKKVTFDFDMNIRIIQIINVTKKPVIRAFTLFDLIIYHSPDVSHKRKKSIPNKESKAGAARLIEKNKPITIITK